MRTLLSSAAVLALTIPVLAPQERSGPKKMLTFPEAIEAAKKAVDAEKYGAAITAMQAGIRDLQKKQRVQILAALPKPDGWQIEEHAVDEQANEMALGLLGAGQPVSRSYNKGEQSISVEVTANYPMMQMLAALFANPTLIQADGGELVKYGPHKAILKKTGDNGQELQILMHDTHLIKVSSEGLSADDLLKIFDQACVDRLEKPLGK